MKYFKIEEFDCKETGENDMKPNFLAKLDELRHRCNFPFKITSGYRSTKHSIERKKRVPGTHTQGIASDIAIYSGVDKYVILTHALDLGFTGIGIADNFIHVDTRVGSPVIWTY